MPQLPQTSSQPFGGKHACPLCRVDLLHSTGCTCTLYTHSHKPGPRCCWWNYLTSHVCWHRMADLGMNIVTVIHQPRYSVFSLFHEVLLLGKAGRTVFQVRCCPSSQEPLMP